MRRLKLRVGGLELEYECEPEELPTIISGVLEAVGPRLLQNGGSGRGAEDPPQAIEVYIREWPSCISASSTAGPLRVKLV